MNKQGSTIVMITHDRDLARSMPRVVEILDGEIRVLDARAETDALGSDFLFITAGTGITEEAELLPYAPEMLDTRLDALEYVAALYPVDARARRNELISEVQTSGVTVSAISSSGLDLLQPVNGSVAFGRFQTPT